ncbi:EAL domain-containing protein [Methyloversatilis sp.]|uniref:EAL domain-containing protein n=1 Tax=Methyloversatilis sp. TaxID=2569862 RepID=UPI002732C731|nr:EAL domain-containing protein [Methyloversatilis sp.]MDP2868794.1 EAL domain-containing protein [Methyloversatilis sp.]MDP3454902.1 EAL domain-containing protein [Methyloversatilis sp.]MDP3577960.1 EAL domain-containing protein [Methyloversatilis sp.]
MTRSITDIQPGTTGCSGCKSPADSQFQLSFAYQPIVDVIARTIFAHEALVRGPAGEGAASVLDKVDDKNRYWFDQICRRTAIEGAARLGMSELLSINFLPNAIYRPEVCIRATLDAARDFNFPVEQILFEATEGERVGDARWLSEIFTEYQRLGFKTAIDDFGAGYSGLNLLALFQPDYIKIDMELIRNIDQRRASRAIVRGVLRTCEELGIAVIAEGVETVAERDVLIDSGVRLMQGWLFAKAAFNSIATVDPLAWPDPSRVLPPRRRASDRISPE